MVRAIGAWIIESFRLAWRVDRAMADLQAAMHIGLWQKYRQFGMPYGDSRRGFQRWLAEYQRGEWHTADAMPQRPRLPDGR